MKDQLRIVGGGLVSNDDELVHGESFIRNFLTGRIFLQSETEYGPPLEKNFSSVWFPDNFGHDPQLPVILEVSCSCFNAHCCSGNGNRWCWIR